MSSLLVLIAVAGCFGGGDEDAADPTTTTESPGPGDYEVTIRNYTAEGLVGEPVNVTWQVSPALDASNATNQSVVVRHTNVHWGDESIAEPAAPQEPPGTVPTSPTSTLTGTATSEPLRAAVTTHATTTTTTSTSTATNGTGGPNSTGQSGGGAQAYPNETEEQSGPPGIYNESFLVQDPGIIYLRVHAIIGNQSYWSDEVNVNVTSNGTLPLGTQHVVEIGKTTPGPVSDYTPKALSIKAGDSVVWKNVDALSLPHTATSTAGTPSFDTGSIAKNAVSRPVFFNATGSWTYRCSVHPDTMNGATVVAT